MYVNSVSRTDMQLKCTASQAPSLAWLRSRSLIGAVIDKGPMSTLETYFLPTQTTSPKVSSSTE